MLYLISFSRSGVRVTKSLAQWLLLACLDFRRLLVLDSSLLFLRNLSDLFLPPQFPCEAGTTTHCLIVTLWFLEFTCQCTCFWNPHHSPLGRSIFLSCILRSEDLRNVLAEKGCFPFLNNTLRGKGKRILFLFLQASIKTFKISCSNWK